MDGQRKPYDGPEPYIFVSYARADKEKVYPLLDALSAAGYRIWYDVDGIPWKKDWADVIAEHIDESAVVLAFHSEASNKSRNCREEVYYTLGEEKELFSVYVDGVQFKRGLKMRLAPYQAVKLSEFADASAFIKRLGQEEAFAACRAVEEVPTLSTIMVWQRVGKIQWQLDTYGVLMISRSDALPDWEKTSSFPDYKYVPENDDNAAPWMQYRKKIISVVIRNDINKIGGYAFYNCKNLTTIHIPDSVTSIGDSVFRFCENLTAVNIPDSVTSIGRDAFWGCKKLTSVHIPDSVTSIGKNAFNGCENLTAVHIPDSVTSIGYGAFYGCLELTDVHIPDSVTSIGDGAFNDCENLTAVYIPDSVISIGEAAFRGCGNLTAVHISDKVTSIAPFAFGECWSLTAVHIPDGVTSIGRSAFCNCRNLTTVHIPDSVTSIGDCAFEWCRNLTDVHIPDSVDSIGDSAFLACFELTSVHIPDSVTSIGEGAFRGCPLTTVEVPAGTDIHPKAFNAHVHIIRRE